MHDDPAERRATPSGIFVLAALPAVASLFLPDSLPYVLVVEALWISVWSVYGIDGAWRAFRWIVALAGIAAVYWFVFMAESGVPPQ